MRETDDDSKMAAVLPEALHQTLHVAVIGAVVHPDQRRIFDRSRAQLHRTARVGLEDIGLNGRQPSSDCVPARAAGEVKEHVGNVAAREL